MATTLREIGFKLGYDVDKASEKKAEDSIKSLKDTATKLLGAIGIGFSLVKINGLIEEFGAVNNGIRSIVDSTEEAAEAQQTVLKAANDCRMSYADMATTVSNLSKATGDIFNVDDAANYAAAVTKVMKTAGRSDSTITGVIEGMNKSFQKGVMDTETLNKMLEDAPETADVLAKHLGVAKSQLLDMASNGTIKVNDLKDAFLESADEIDAAYANVNLTVTDAIKNIRNTWGLWLADMDKTFGVTNSIARAMVKLSDTAMTFAQRIKTRLEWLADKLGGTDKLLKLIAITVGAVFLAINAGKIVSFLKNVRSLLTAHNVKILAIIAAIVLLALLVEDFFAFMKGENSLIGEILERNGVDVDAFRQACKDLWEQVKDIIDVFKQFARTIGNQLLSALKQVLPLLGKLVAAILPVILELAQQIVSFIGRLAQTVLPMIVSMVERLLPFLIQIIETILPLVISLIETLLPLFMQIIEAVLPIIISLIETLLPLVMQIIEAVLPVILELIEAIVPILVQIVETILPVVLELISALLPIIEPIMTIVANLVQSLLPVLVSLLNAILPILEPILAILQPIADILGVIINAIAKVVGWVADGLGWIVDKIFGGGGDTSAAEKVNAYAGGTDNSSETFIAGEEGPELVTGARGRKVFTALETGKIFRAMAMLGKAATAKPSTITNSTSSRTINQYNEFTNTFNGDRAGQAKSEAAMSSASDNAVDAMARALAFAR
uniref:Tail length tape measure protein n=1 Tax=Myoviridae sp. ctbwh6 TaxID=2827611 RepID=A0A8S5LI46_9CAUD|nr:MAG TPA: tail length tape measure protein [Myoviridae sp. ctbwh6]